jgi:hypothetical protein
MRKLAVVLSLLAFGAGLAACSESDSGGPTGVTEAQTTDDLTTARDVSTGQDVAADHKRCGVVLDRWDLAVVRGHTSCRVARRVMHDLVHDRLPICCYWMCGGPDGDVSCTHNPEKGARIVIRARFASSAFRGPKSHLSMRENIERKAGDWAAAFGAGRPAWRFTGQPVGERYACERVSSGPIKNCTRPSPRFRKSFADAKVERIVIDDPTTESGAPSLPHCVPSPSCAPIVATVEFSNGASVEFEGPHGWYVSRRWAKEITRRNHES